MVTVSLDLETITAWEALPVGEKSLRVREALRTALIVSHKDLEIEAQSRRIAFLENELGKCNRAVLNLQAFGAIE